jgi:large subunit ribosomal protein L29
MKPQELRQLTEQDLVERLKVAERDYYQWQREVAAGKEKNHRKLRGVRQVIARLQTVLKETTKIKPPV